MDDSLRKYLALVWHWAWLIVLFVVVAGGLAYLSARLTAPVYRASTTLLVNEAPAGPSTDASSILIRSDRLAQTFANMMSQQPVLDEVIATLKLDMSTGSLKGRVSVTPIKDTQLIQLQVEDGDPQRATDLANTIPAVFSRRNAELQASRYADAKANLTQQLESVSEQITAKQSEIDTVTRSATPFKEADLIRLQSDLAQQRQVYERLAQSFENIRLSESESSSNIVVTEPASVPGGPVRPQPLRDALLGVMVGLALALGLIFLIDYLDRSIRSPDQIETVLKLPVLGMIVRTNVVQTKGLHVPGLSAESELIAVREPRSPVTEAFRGLRTNIQIAGVDQPIRTLLVTSPSPDEGKSLVAANLAVVMAQAGRQVVLLDADLRRPRVSKLFSQREQTGLAATLLEDNRAWIKALMPTKVEGLMTIPAGGLPPNPSELLGSKRMQEFIGYLKDQSDTVVIDSPPLLPVTDALVLAPQLDGVVVVVQHGRTNLSAAVQAVNQLQQAGARVLGVVLNQIPTGRRGYGYNYYYRHYYSTYGEDKPESGGKSGSDKKPDDRAPVVAEASRQAGK